MTELIQKVLSNPTIRIDNIVIVPKANTTMINNGFGEKKVTGISSGGGTSGIAVSEDVSTRIGKIKFALFTTPQNLEYLRTWQSVDIAVGVSISVSEGTFSVSGQNCVVINNPDANIGVDESFEVEFHCRQLVQS
ncbi:MAG: hypothetical protein PVJ67_03710 [Candidatus Pacearchaeota archaeon]|jgi:hypothetical protein